MKKKVCFSSSLFKERTDWKFLFQDLRYPDGEITSESLCLIKPESNYGRKRGESQWQPGRKREKRKKKEEFLFYIVLLSELEATCRVPPGRIFGVMRVIF